MARNINGGRADTGNPTPTFSFVPLTTLGDNGANNQRMEVETEWEDPSANANQMQTVLMQLERLTAANQVLNDRIQQMERNPPAATNRGDEARAPARTGVKAVKPDAFS